MPTRDDQTEPKYDWRYWEAATKKPLGERWGNGALLNEEDKRDLAYRRTLTAFYDDAPENLEIRREIQQAYMAGIMAPEEITRTNRIMPIDSRISKVLSNTCTLYAHPPTRTFTDDPEKEKLFANIYRRGRADIVMNEAHELARLGGLVAVRPRFDRRERIRFQAWTPDRFRVTPHPEDSGEIGSIFYPFTVLVPDGRTTTKFRAEVRVRFWDAAETWVTDKNGREIEGSRQPNRYGRIPFTFVKLREARDGGLYGPGWWSLAAFQVWDNITKLANDRNHLYNSFVVVLAVNLKLTGDLQLGAGRVLTLENLRSTKDMAGGLIDPSLSTLDLQSNFTMGEEFRRERKKELLRDNHLPSYQWDESGQPPSGVALKVMERELRRQEMKDRAGIADAENDLAELTAIVWNRDYFDENGEQISRPADQLLPETLPAFAVDFEEEPVHLDPTVQYELEARQVKDGIRSIGKFYRDWSGDDVVDADDRKVAAKIAERREIAKLAEGPPAEKASDELLGTVGGANSVGELQKTVTRGEIPADQANATLRYIYGLPTEKAAELIPTDGPAPTSSESPPSATPPTDPTAPEPNATEEAPAANE